MYFLFQSNKNSDLFLWELSYSFHRLILKKEKIDNFCLTGGICNFFLELFLVLYGLYEVCPNEVDWMLLHYKGFVCFFCVFFKY